jgi:hypothetical protein
MSTLCLISQMQTKQTPWPGPASELYRQSDRDILNAAVVLANTFPDMRKQLNTSQSRQFSKDNSIFSITEM